MMASSQMHCCWTSICTRQSTSESWLFSTFSVTDVDLTNLVIACSIPWPILVNGVPKVLEIRPRTWGPWKLEFPYWHPVLFDVWYCSTVPLTKKPRDTLTKWIQTAKNIFKKKQPLGVEGRGRKHKTSSCSILAPCWGITLSSDGWGGWGQFLESPCSIIKCVPPRLLGHGSEGQAFSIVTSLQWELGSYQGYLSWIYRLHRASILAWLLSETSFAYKHWSSFEHMWLG